MSEPLHLSNTLTSVCLLMLRQFYPLAEGLRVQSLNKLVARSLKKTKKKNNKGEKCLPQLEPSPLRRLFVSELSVTVLTGLISQNKERKKNPAQRRHFERRPHFASQEMR